MFSIVFSASQTTCLTSSSYPCSLYVQNPSMILPWSSWFPTLLDSSSTFLILPPSVPLLLVSGKNSNSRSLLPLSATPTFPPSSFVLINIERNAGLGFENTYLVLCKVSENTSSHRAPSVSSLCYLITLILLFAALINILPPTLHLIILPPPFPPTSSLTSLSPLCLEIIPCLHAAPASY